jgi:hypothetical protein
MADRSTPAQTRFAHPESHDQSLWPLAGLSSCIIQASVFWIRKMAAIGGEQAAVEYWQIKRDHTRRGIVEVIGDDSK